MNVVKEHLLFSATPWGERLYVDGFDRALSVGLNADGKPVMWYVADDETVEMSTLIIIHTVFPDHEPGDGDFVGTVVYDGQVIHVWCERVR